MGDNGTGFILTEITGRGQSEVATSSCMKTEKPKLVGTGKMSLRNCDEATPLHFITAFIENKVILAIKLIHPVIFF